MNINESIAAFRGHKQMLADKGIVLDGVIGYMTPEMKRDYTIARDALPALATASNAGIPAYLSMYIDPEAVRVNFAPMEATSILEEKKQGDWVTDTAMFPVVESTGEVSSYSDEATNGRAGVNMNFPQRQSYHFQTMKFYGEREMERAALARMNLVSELDIATAEALNRFSNLTYFFGVAGLQNYGFLNDPNLGASLTPGTKAAGGVKWVLPGGVINATANEIYADIQAVFYQLTSQTKGLVKAKDKMVFACDPGTAVALTATNSFGVDVYDLLKKNFPNIRFETAVQYAVTSASNPNGIAGGNLVQLIAEKVAGQNTAFCAFTEKMRSHAIVKETSAFKQKVTSGTWGSVVRKPLGFASMLGV